MNRISFVKDKVNGLVGVILFTVNNYDFKTRTVYTDKLDGYVKWVIERYGFDAIEWVEETDYENYFDALLAAAYMKYKCQKKYGRRCFNFDDDFREELLRQRVYVFYDLKEYASLKDNSVEKYENLPNHYISDKSLPVYVTSLKDVFEKANKSICDYDNFVYRLYNKIYNLFEEHSGAEKVVKVIPTKYEHKVFTLQSKGFAKFCRYANFSTREEALKMYKEFAPENVMTDEEVQEKYPDGFDKYYELVKVE